MSLRREGYGRLDYGFTLRHSALLFAIMTSRLDLPSAGVVHVSSMLILAKQKHEEAMTMIGTPDANAISRLRHVLQLLEEVEVLAQDAASYVRSDAMAAALKELHQQQASIALPSPLQCVSACLFQMERPIWSNG